MADARPAAAAPGSLRRTLLLYLGALLAVFAVALLFAARDYGQRAANRSYDHLLASSALSIADSVALADGQWQVDLPYAALDLLAMAPEDRVFYRVADSRGTLITGYGDLPVPPRRPGSQPQFFDARYSGETVRFVVVGRSFAAASAQGEVLVQVGQTRRAREAVAQDMVNRSLLAIGVLSGLLLALVAFGVHRAFRPLVRVERELSRREPSDLKPLDARVPREMDQMVAALNRFMERLSSSNETLRAFMAEAAHQMRTPLAALRAQGGQRGTHLVRGFRHERAQGLVAARQPLHEAVQRRHHLVHLTGHTCIQRLQVRRFTAREFAFHPHQWPECTVYTEGDQRQQQTGQHTDRQQRPVDHVLRHRLARAPGLADLHQHLALRGRSSEAAAHHHEAHGLTAVARIEELRLASRAPGWHRQVAVASDQRAATVRDAVEHPVLRRHRQQVERRVRQVDLPLAIGQRHRIGDGQCRGRQQVIVGAVGRTLAVVACGKQQGDCEHRQQRTQIQQQGPPQRTRRGRCRARVSHRCPRLRREPRASNRRRARS